MNRFIFALAFAGLSSLAQAKDLSNTSCPGGNCGTPVKKSCCSSGCPEIVACPPTASIERKVCDPNIHIYEVEGYFNYWTEFMQPPRRTCEYQMDQFDAMVFVPETQYDPARQEYIYLKKVVIYPWWVQDINVSEKIAHQLQWQKRRFKARGCYVDKDHFIVEAIDYARHTVPAASK